MEIPEKSKYVVVKQELSPPGLSMAEETPCSLPPLKPGDLCLIPRNAALGQIGRDVWVPAEYLRRSDEGQYLLMVLKNGRILERDLRYIASIEPKENFVELGTRVIAKFTTHNQSGEVNVGRSHYNYATVVECPSETNNYRYLVVFDRNMSWSYVRSNKVLPLYRGKPFLDLPLTVQDCILGKYKTLKVLIERQNTYLLEKSQKIKGQVMKVDASLALIRIVRDFDWRLEWIHRGSPDLL